MLGEHRDDGVAGGERRRELGDRPSSGGSSGATTPTTPVGSGTENDRNGAATGLMPPSTGCSLSVQPA